MRKQNIRKDAFLMQNLGVPFLGFCRREDMPLVNDTLQLLSMTTVIFAMIPHVSLVVPRLSLNPKKWLVITPKL